MGVGCECGVCGCVGVRVWGSVGVWMWECWCKRVESVDMELTFWELTFWEEPVSMNEYKEWSGVCVRVCMHACMYICVCMCACVRASTFGSVGCVAVKSWRVQLSVNVERVGV